MSSPSLQGSSEGSTHRTDANDAAGEHRPSSVRITVIVQNRYTFGTGVVSGRQIKETANIPTDFALYRRLQRGNERILDDAPVELRNGDHFFARPPSNESQPGGRLEGATDVRRRTAGTRNEDPTSKATPSRRERRS